MTRREFPLPLLLLLLTFSLGIVDASSPGNPICPCTTVNRSIAVPIQLRLRELGRTSKYGLEGCRDYGAEHEANVAAELLAASLDVDADEQTRLMARQAKIQGYCRASSGRANEQCSLKEVQQWARSKYAATVGGVLGAFALTLADAHDVDSPPAPHIWCYVDQKVCKQQGTAHRLLKRCLYGRYAKRMPLSAGKWVAEWVTQR